MLDYNQLKGDLLKFLLDNDSRFLQYCYFLHNIQTRRIGNSWKAEIEARIFSAIDTQDVILSNFKQDSFLKFSISKFF